MGYLRVSKRVSEGDLMRYPRGYPIRCPVHNINLPTKKYLAGVASPASLFSPKGAWLQRNLPPQILFVFNFILTTNVPFVKNFIITQVVFKAIFVDFPP